MKTRPERKEPYRPRRRGKSRSPGRKDAEIPSKRRRVLSAWLGLGVVLFFLTSKSLVTVIIKISRPRVSSSCLTRPRESPLARMNILVDLDPPTVASLSFDRRELTLIYLPRETLKVEDLSLGPDDCLEVALARQASLLTGLPVDGYLLLDNHPGRLASEKLLSLTSLRWLARPNKIFQAISTTKTDYAIKELYSLWRWARELRPNKVYLTSLEGTRYYNQEEDVFYLEAVDELISSTLYDPLVREENIRVVVLNGSELPGVATQIARLVAGLGAELVSVDNLTLTDCQALALRCPKDYLDQSILMVREQYRSSETVRRLGEYYQLELVKRDDLPELADLYLIAGQELEKYWVSLETGLTSKG